MAFARQSLGPFALLAVFVLCTLASAAVVDLDANLQSVSIDFPVPVLVDESMQRSIEDVLVDTDAFVPTALRDLMVSRYPSAVWARLDLRDANDHPREWQLLIEGSGFQIVQLYFNDVHTGGFRQLPGTILPVRDAASDHGALFTLPTVSDTAATAYLYLVAHAPLLVRATVWDNGRLSELGAFRGLGEPAFGVLTVMTVMTLLIGLLWRDRRLLLLAGLCASGLLALLFADGLAWQIQGLNHLGTSSMAMVFFVAVALFFGLRFCRATLGLVPAPTPLARIMFALEVALIAVAVLSVLMSRSWEPTLMRALVSVGYASAALAMVTGLMQWRAQRRRSALLIVAAWGWLVLAVGGYLLAQFSAFWHEHGLHLAVAGAILLLAVAYIDLVMHMRGRYDLKIARGSGDALQWRVERSRRDFAAEVNELIEQLDPNLYEEAIMARFLEYLSNMVPVAAAAVAASHRGDVRLVVVGQDAAEDGFESILATREQLLQSVCLSDRAAVIHSDDLGVNAVPDSASCLGIVPLRAPHDEWAGVLLARSGDLEFGLDELDLVHDFAHQAQEALRSAQQFRKVKRQAETDSLTGILNRRAVLVRGKRYFKKHRSLKTPLSLLFVDVDFFKRVNDEWGHQVGDQTLRRVAQVCSHCLRDDDFIGRYGGEEFLAVLPGASAKEAQLVAERLRQAVEKEVITAGDAQISVTVSVGISELSDTFADLDTMLRAADRALYRAKREGRNRVIHHRYMLRGDRVSKPFSS